eukprot:jgi/Tetstr1/453554/TSEL_040522.t1
MMVDTLPPLQPAAGMSSLGLARNHLRGNPHSEHARGQPPPTLTRSYEFSYERSSSLPAISKTNSPLSASFGSSPLRTLSEKKAGIEPPPGRAPFRTMRPRDPLCPEYQLPSYTPPAPVPERGAMRSRREYPTTCTMHCADIPGASATQRRQRTVPLDTLSVKDINAPKRLGETRPLASLICMDITGPPKYHKQNPNYVPKPDPAKWDRQIPAQFLKGGQLGRLPKKPCHPLFGDLPRRTVVQRPINLIEPPPAVLLAA